MTRINHDEFEQVVAEVEGEILDLIRSGHESLDDPENVPGAMKSRIFSKLEEHIDDQGQGDKSPEYPALFEVRVVGTVYASSEDEAKQRLIEELDISGDGRRDYMELEELQGDSVMKSSGNENNKDGENQ